MNQQITYDALGVHPNAGQKRVICPECGESHRGRKKTLGVDTDRGLFNCFRCGFKGRIGEQKGGAWYDEHIQRMQEAERKRKAEQHAAMLAAREYWGRSARAMWHGYAKKKGVLPINLRQLDDVLIVPMHNIRRELVNVQRIYSNGKKLFLKGGQVKGTFFEIQGKQHAPIYICEGVATGLSLHMYVYPHSHVLCAFAANNLLPVAQAVRDLYPESEIVIAADNDQFTKGNPGISKAKEAAAAVGAGLVYPKFEPDELATRPSDFNDMTLINRGKANG